MTAALALMATLGCCSLGVCWKLFVPDPHHCCARTEAPTMSPVGPCASAADSVAVVKVAPPSSSALPDLPYPTPTIHVESAFAPSFHVKPPPLVLRT